LIVRVAINKGARGCVSQTTQQRQSPRYPLERLAKLRPANGGAAQYCLVPDMPEGRVRLNALGSKIPDVFILNLSGDGPAQDGRYSVIWRLGGDVGAKRLPPAPDPEWSY
jgi:hypothetical protein